MFRTRCRLFISDGGVFMSAVVTQPKASVKSKPRTGWSQVRDKYVSYIFVAPFFILFSIFTVFPVLLSIVLSFTYFNMLEWPTWIGWSNYIRLFLADDVFLIAVKNTLIYASITGPLS